MGERFELGHRRVDLIQHGALLWLAEQHRDDPPMALAKGCGRLTKNAVFPGGGAAGAIEQRVGDARERRNDDDDGLWMLCLRDRDRVGDRVRVSEGRASELMDGDRGHGNRESGIGNREAEDGKDLGMPLLR